MCAITQVQHMLVSETTDESITQINHIGKCNDSRILMLVLKYNFMMMMMMINILEIVWNVWDLLKHVKNLETIAYWFLKSHFSSLGNVYCTADILGQLEYWKISMSASFIALISLEYELS